MATETEREWSEFVTQPPPLPGGHQGGLWEGSPLPLRWERPRQRLLMMPPLGTGPGPGLGPGPGPGPGPRPPPHRPPSVVVDVSHIREFQSDDPITSQASL